MCNSTDAIASKNNKHFESSQKLRKDAHCCTMLCTGVLYMLSHELCSVPVHPPIFKMYTSEILYETESSFEIMFSELKKSGK